MTGFLKKRLPGDFTISEVRSLAGGSSKEQFAFDLAWTLFRGIPVLQAVFALKTLWLFPTGIALWKILEHEESSIRRFLYVGFLCAGLGLIVAS